MTIVSLQPPLPYPTITHIVQLGQGMQMPPKAKNYAQVLKARDTLGYGGTVVAKEERGGGVRLEAWVLGDTNVDALALSFLHAAAALITDPFIRVKLQTVIQILVKFVEEMEGLDGQSPPPQDDNDLPF